MAPEEGIEPPTRRLTAACSATELLRNVEGDDYGQPRFEVKQFERATVRPSRDAVYFPAASPVGGAGTVAPGAGPAAGRGGMTGPAGGRHFRTRAALSK